MSTNRSTNFAAAAFAALSICCANSSAQAADSGFYIGAGAGRVEFKDQVASPSGGTLDFDAAATGTKGFAGYRLHTLPLLDLAAEATFHHFGGATQSVRGQSLTYRMDAGSLAGLLILPLGPVDFFGKGGAIYSSLSKNIDGTTSSRSATDPFYGAGIGLRVGKIGIRAEYEYFDVSNLGRMQMYSASFSIQF